MYYLKALLALITQHLGLAYGVVFLVSFAESLAVVGLIVPGTVMMFGVGAIVATGRLGLKPVLLLAVAGAIGGDGISYWLGHHYQQRLQEIWPFSRYPGMIKKGEIFFHRHGGKSVLLGRFVGPVRAIIPVVAGMLGMRPLAFTVVNVLSAIGWAFAYVLLGVFFGASLGVAGAVSMRLAVLLFLLVATSWGFLWFVHKIVLMVGHRGPMWIAALKDWLSADTAVKGSVLSIRRFLFHLFDRQHGEELFFGALVMALFAAGWGFLGVLQDVLAKDPLVLVDQSVYHFFQSLRTPWADAIFVVVTELGDSFVNISLACAILLALLGKRCYRAAGFWAISVLGGLVGVQLLKWAIHLPRPVAFYHGASVYGFPSGHTAMSVVLYGFLAILLVRGFSSAWRWGIFVAVLLVSFVIALSRLYLGAHWLSDVLGGFFIGTSWAALLGIAYLKRPDEGVPRRLLGLVALLAVVIAGGWHVSQSHARDLGLYTPKANLQSMSLATWLADGWRDLPAWRIDLAGEREQPLTIQWVGSADELADYLSTKGWQQPPSLNLKNFLGMLSPDMPIGRLPVLPLLHSGRVDRLRLVHLEKNQRWVLRLWPTDVRIGGSNIPLFVGTIEIQQRRHLTWLITAPRDTGEYDRPEDGLRELLHNRFALKLVGRRSNEIQVENEHRRLHWNGKVLLVWQEAA